MQHPQSKTSKE